MRTVIESCQVQLEATMYGGQLALPDWEGALVRELAPLVWEPLETVMNAHGERVSLYVEGLLVACIYLLHSLPAVLCQWVLVLGA